MKFVSKAVVCMAALAMIGLTEAPAYADGLVLVGPQIQKLVPPLAALNLQHHGNSSTEAGGVRWSGIGDLAFGDISAGPHQHTVALSDLVMGGQAQNLGVLLNINEANGGTKGPITVNSLQLIAYDQLGNAVFMADLINGDPVTLDHFRHGQGANSDYIFGLDSEAAARLQAAMDANSNLRLGLTAALSNVNGGPERFSFGAAAADTPEPTTLILLGTGLAGIAGAVRRRRNAKAKALESNTV
jgi:hypothetical protein